MLVGLAFATATSAGPLDFRPFPNAPGVLTVSDPSVRPILPNGVAAAIGYHTPVDLLGDGRPDILVCHFGVTGAPMPCRMLRPLPDGRLAEVTREHFGPGPLPSTVWPVKIIAEDFNGDARADLFVAAWGYDAPPFPGERNLYVSSKPDGGYIDRSSALPQANANTYNACGGDVDGNGIADVFVLNFKSDGLQGSYWLKGAAEGGFVQSTQGVPDDFLGIGKGYSMGTCAIADLDLDGHADLVLGTFGDVHSDNVVLFNDGTGDFTKRPRVLLPVGPLAKGAWEFSAIGVLDVNRDGYPDLLLAASLKPGYTGLGYQILVNRGDGTFTDETASRLLAAPTTPIVPLTVCLNFVFVDLDGDGWEDFFCNSGGWDPAVARVWMNDGSGRFAPAPAGQLPQGSFAEALDMDGDGRPDLIGYGVRPDGDLFSYTYRNHAPRVAPSAPRVVAAHPGDGVAILHFEPPVASGNAPIDSYTASCTSGPPASRRQAAGAGSPLVVGGLSNGTTYACTVKAQNAHAIGPESAVRKVAVKAAPVGTTPAVEFRHAAFDHYFVTAIPGEIAALDGGAFAGWARTGLRFNVLASPSPQASPVCRFFSASFAPRSSHFYSTLASECEGLLANPDWQAEGIQFHVSTPNPANGTCPVGQTPVYRLYNNARNGAPNHRFTTDLALRNQMVARGYAPEGYGVGVTMCAPH